MGKSNVAACGHVFCAPPAREPGPSLAAAPPASFARRVPPPPSRPTRRVPRRSAARVRRRVPPVRGPGVRGHPEGGAHRADRHRGAARPAGPATGHSHRGRRRSHQLVGGADGDDVPGVRAAARRGAGGGGGGGDAVRPTVSRLLPSLPGPSWFPLSPLPPRRYMRRSSAATASREARFKAKLQEVHDAYKARPPNAFHQTRPAKRVPPNASHAHAPPASRPH